MFENAHSHIAPKLVWPARRPFVDPYAAMPRVGESNSLWPKSPRYLSPSSIDLWNKDRIQWFNKYVVGVIAEPQTPPMAVGSAFDAYVKCQIDGGDYMQALQDCVEGPLLDQMHPLGKDIFDRHYQRGMGRLIEMGMTPATSSTDLDETFTTTNGTPVRVKPDLIFERRSKQCVLDWKASGYYSAKGASNIGGYNYSDDSANQYKCVPLADSRIPEKWRRQLYTYGYKYESRVLMVHVLNFKPIPGFDQKKCTLCEYTEDVQDDLMQTYLDEYDGCWEALKSGRIFTDVSYDDDISMQKDLIRNKDQAVNSGWSAIAVDPDEQIAALKRAR